MRTANDNDTDPDPATIECCLELIDLIPVFQGRGLSGRDIATLFVTQAVALLITVNGISAGEAKSIIGQVTAEAVSGAVDGGSGMGGSA